jgi:hypothetical protein
MIEPGAGTSNVRMRRIETSASSSQPGLLRQSSRSSLSTLGSPGFDSFQPNPSNRDRFANFQ